MTRKDIVKRTRMDIINNTNPVYSLYNINISQTPQISFSAKKMYVCIWVNRLYIHCNTLFPTRANSNGWLDEGSSVCYNCYSRRGDSISYILYD